MAFGPSFVRQLARSAWIPLVGKEAAPELTRDTQGRRALRRVRVRLIIKPN